MMPDQAGEADKGDDLLAQEYLQLQKTVEDFDARALTIKAWSVTFSAAGLGLAYQQHNRILLLIAALSAVVFWIVEAIWKLHQRAFYPRIEEIEAHFAARPGQAFAPFQILRSWRRNYDGRDRIDEKGVWRRLAVPFFAGVLLPHAVIATAGVLLYLYAPPPAEPQPSGPAATPPRR